jgi:hypothetical protein
LDEELMERLSEEAEEEILSKLQGEIGSIREIEVYVEVLKGQLGEDVKWSKDLPLDKPINIYLVLDSTKKHKKDVWEAAKNVQQILNEEGYNYEVNINGKTNEDYVKFAVSFLPESTIDLRDIEVEEE